MFLNLIQFYFFKSQVIFHFLTENGYTENSPRANESDLEACLRFRQDSLDYRCGVFLPIHDCIRDILSQQDFERFMQTMNMKVALSGGQKLSSWKVLYVFVIIALNYFKCWFKRVIGL